MTDPVEVIARAICAEAGDNPDGWEPGDVLGVDGYLQNGDPAHLMWREYAAQARAALSALEAERLVVVPIEATDEMIEGVSSDHAFPVDHAIRAIWRDMLAARPR